MYEFVIILRGRVDLIQFDNGLDTETRKFVLSDTKVLPLSEFEPDGSLDGSGEGITDVGLDGPGCCFCCLLRAKW